MRPGDLGEALAPALDPREAQPKHAPQAAYVGPRSPRSTHAGEPSFHTQAGAVLLTPPDLDTSPATCGGHPSLPQSEEVAAQVRQGERTSRGETFQGQRKR